MPTLGEQLRAAREAQGLSVYEVAEATKIKTEHIRALDEGQYRSFAAPIYLRGFVRTYARLVRLDPETAIAQLNQELVRDAVFADPTISPPGDRGVIDLFMLQLSKVNWRVAVPSLAVALVALVGIFGYRAWMEHRHADPLSGLGPGIHESPSPGPGELLPLPAPPARP
jgi:cytoskeleton protein RodZ